MLNVDMQENQYPIERDKFCGIFFFMEVNSIYYEVDIETRNFKYWRYDDDYYILRKEDGVLIGWYKHLGRINVANEPLDEKDYIKFAEQFKQELMEEGVLTDEELLEELL